MIHSQKILWGEGLFLRPQHFQQQDAYHEWRLAQMTRLIHPYAWGIKHIKIDTDALQSGLLRILEIQAVMPDGELFNAPSEDDLPPAIALNELSSTDSEEIFTWHWPRCVVQAATWPIARMKRTQPFATITTTNR